MAENAKLSDAEQKAATDAHLENGVAEPQWWRHWFQLLFVPPAVLNGMELAGVDSLHLIELNLFKALFKYTIHESLPCEYPSPLFVVAFPSNSPSTLISFTKVCSKVLSEDKSYALVLPTTN